MSLLAVRWSVHLPTAAQTCVRLALPQRSDGSPWPFTLVLSALQRAGAQATGRFRSLGAGRGDPLIASQALLWRGCALELESVVFRDHHAELSLALPSWDELVDSEAAEDDLWELVDAVAAAVDARHGAVGDGEPLGPEPESSIRCLDEALARHPILLVRSAGPAAGATGWRAARYRELPGSGMAVLVR